MATSGPTGASHARADVQGREPVWKGCWKSAARGPVAKGDRKGGSSCRRLPRIANGEAFAWARASLATNETATSTKLI
jgi:hypothetical protein